MALNLHEEYYTEAPGNLLYSLKLLACKAAAQGLDLASWFACQFVAQAKILYYFPQNLATLRSEIKLDLATFCYFCICMQA